MTESSSSPRRTPPRRPPGKGGPGRSASSPIVELAAIETPPELILFNAYLSAEKDLERERQRVRQAEVAKDKAAARLKELQSGGSSEEVKAAEAEYRQLVEAWKRVRDGEADEPAVDADAVDGGSGEGSEGAGVDADAGDVDVVDGESGDAPEGDTSGNESGEALADAGATGTEGVATSGDAEAVAAEEDQPGDAPDDAVAGEGDEA